MTDKQDSLAIMQADMDTALRQNEQNETEETATKSARSESVTTREGSALTAVETSRVIEMAWEDRTPFAPIQHSYGLAEAGVIKLMRQTLKPSSFRLWRERVTGHNTKHEAKRSFEVGRAYCKTQYKPR